VAGVPSWYRLSELIHRQAVKRFLNVRKAMTEKEHLDLNFNRLLTLFKAQMFVFIKFHKPNHLLEFKEVAELSDEAFAGMNKHASLLPPEYTNQVVCLANVLETKELITQCFPDLKNPFDFANEMMH
jgi:hypothetical protein